MTEEQIIEDAIQGHASTRDAIRWAMNQVRKDAEPVAFEFQHEDTGLIDFVDPQQVEWGFQKNNPRWQLIGPVFRHPAPAVVHQLVEALEQLMSIVKIYSRATSNNFAWAEMDFAKEALAAAKDAGL